MHGVNDKVVRCTHPLSALFPDATGNALRNLGPFRLAALHALRDKHVLLGAPVALDETRAQNLKQRTTHIGVKTRLPQHLVRIALLWSQMPRSFSVISLIRCETLHRGL